MNGDKLAGKIPDVYFDWYARLLPGAIFLTFYFLISQKNPTISSAYFFLYLALSYIAGYIVQPASIFIIVILQKIAGCNEEKYKDAKKDTNLYKLTQKVSKAHAEAVGMLSTSILLLTVTTYCAAWSLLYGLAIAYFFAASIERVYARKRKIEDLS